MKKIIVSLFIGLLSIGAFAQTCTDLVYNGKFPSTTEPVTIICHKRYVIGYSKIRKTPLWSAEKLTIDYVSAKSYPRKDNFRPDPMVPYEAQAAIDEFIGTGYDKGHLSSFDDFSDDRVAGDQSFYMTNMIPQLAANNRGIWKSLEMHTRTVAISKKEIYIISGPIFYPPFIKPLNKGTLVPNSLYKVVLSPNTNEVYSFSIPNKKISSSLLPNYFVTYKKLSSQIKPLDLFPGIKPMEDKISF